MTHYPAGHPGAPPEYNENDDPGVLIDGPRLPLMPNKPPPDDESHLPTLASLRGIASEPPVDWQARALAAEALLKEWVDYHEEFDAYPTSDKHPLYKTRKLLGLEQP